MLHLISCFFFQRSWQGRPNTLSVGPSRGRGGSLERGGRISRGRGYQYTRSTTYDGDQSDWSPRKEYSQRPVSMENWRRARIGDQEDDGWRGVGLGRSSSHEKWGKCFEYLPSFQIREWTMVRPRCPREKNFINKMGKRNNWKLFRSS